MRISDWSSDVCSSDLPVIVQFGNRVRTVAVDRDAERRADAEAIADIGIVAGELAIGNEPAIGVARIGLDLEVRGRVPFEVEDGLVGFEIRAIRTEEPMSEFLSLMSISYAVFCLKKEKHI